MADDSIFDKIIEFKMLGKQLSRDANRSLAAQKKHESKIRGLLAKNDTDSAKLEAQQAISSKKEYLRLNALSYKVTTISNKLQSMSRVMDLNDKLKNVVKIMPEFSSVQSTANAMETLENFEKMVDNIDVHTANMDKMFDNVNSCTANEEEVNDLLSQYQMVNAFKIGEDLKDANTNQVFVPGVQNSNENMKNHA